MLNRKRTWIVVADAGRARVFRPGRPDEGFVPVEGGSFDNPNVHDATRDLGTDRPGRSVESVGAARHAQEPRVDLHRQAKSNFAKLIAEYVDRGAQDKKFDDLVLVAPPQMLGDLRAALGKQSADRIVSTIDKDLTKLPLPEMAESIRAVVRI